MRTRFLSALLALCLLLSGCAWAAKQKSQAAAKKAAEKLENAFETNLNIKLGEMQAEAVFIRESPSSCTVRMLSPDSIKGTEMVFTEDKMHISYMGLSLSVDPNSVPGSAAIKLLISALDSSLQQEGVDLSYENRVLTATGEAGTGRFTLKIDPENGNLLSLSIPEEELEIEFKNFKFLG